MSNQNHCPYSGKIKFPSERIARTAVNRQLKGRLFKSDSYKVILDIYICPDCGSYHLGTEFVTTKRRLNENGIEFLLIDLGDYISQISKRNRILRKRRD